MRRGLAVALCSLGCSPAPIDLGEDPDFLFFTDHESGDLSAWRARGPTWENAGGTLSLVSSTVRSGRFAVDASIVSQPVGTQSAAFLIAGGLPANAYYSAWFYLPEAPSPSYYWVLFKLGAEDPPPATSSTEVWGVDLEPAPGGATMRLFSALYPDAVLDLAPAVPIGRWFQIEAFVRAPTPDDGELRIWVDGVSILERHGPTLPTSTVSWVVGSGAEALDAGAATIFVDDAAVTRRRLGPEFPPFWRGSP